MPSFDSLMTLPGPGRAFKYPNLRVHGRVVTVLPKWLLFISTIAFGQVFASYRTQVYNKQVYTAKPELVNPLMSRMFGTWSMAQSVIRLYSCWRLDDPAWYDLTVFTFAWAAFHFLTEWLVFRTANFGRGLMAPLTVTGISLPWMLAQRSFYVK